MKVLSLWKNKMSIRSERIKEIIRDTAAHFLMLENNGSSLITVTSVELSSDEKNAKILFTVFPEAYQKTALEFAKRKRSDFKQYFKEHTKLGRIPMFDFAIDLGEKNRQRIDNLLNQG